MSGYDRIQAVAQQCGWVIAPDGKQGHYDPYTYYRRGAEGIRVNYGDRGRVLDAEEWSGTVKTHPGWGWGGYAAGPNKAEQVIARLSHTSTTDNPPNGK